MTVKNPEQRLDAFLAEEWLYYDGIDDGHPDEVTVVDVLAPVFVNAYFGMGAAKLRALHRELAAACNPVLPSVPAAADLSSRDVAFGPIGRLLGAAVSVRGVLLPRATKVLFRKRRELVPILDNEVICHYARSLGDRGLVEKSQSLDPAVVAEVAVTVLRAFRDDLVSAHHDLSGLADRCAQQRVPVGPLRALEILVWTEVEPRGYYRSES